MVEIGSRWFLNWTSSSVLTMPFPTCVEAELARQSLESSAYPLGGAVQQEVTVLGNLLAMSVPQGSWVAYVAGWLGSVFNQGGSHREVGPLGPVLWPSG